jgi:outer membrane protein TolC
MNAKNFFVRKKSQRIIDAISFTFMLPCLLAGQDQLTLEQAWSIALKNNYNVQQQEILIEKARDEIVIQRTDYYPSLSTMGVLARANFDQFPINLPNASGKVGIDLLSLSVTQPIFTGLSTKNLVASAQENMIAQEIQKKILQNTVLYEVGNLFYEIQSNLLQQKTLETSIDRLKNQMNHVYHLYLSEQATPFDTLEISNRILQTSNSLATLGDGYLILQSNLTYLLNTENLPPVKPLAVFDLNFILEEPDTYLTRAQQYRPELKHIAAQKNARTFYTDVLKARYYPQLSASFAYNFMKLTGDIVTEEWTNFYSVLINFQWELWNWKRDAKKVQQAKLDIQNLDIQEKQTIEDIKHQITIAYQNLLSAAKKIILQKRLVDQEKERFRITENRYQQGLATFLDLNAAELDLTEAETELHKNYITWYKNQLHLAFATGEIGKTVAEVTNE